MILSQEQYEALSERVQAGEFLRQETLAALPPLPANAAENQSFREQCQQTLNLYQSKIKALQAKLEALRKELESDHAAREADTRVADFNDKLEEKYRKLQEKSTEELRNAKKALEDLQTLSDNVLEENKRLKEEGCTQQSAPAAAAPQTEIRQVVDFCIGFVGDTEAVADRYVDVIRRMIEALIVSSLGDAIPSADKLGLIKRLNSLEKTRKQQANQRKEKERQAERSIIQHNTNCSQFFEKTENPTINHDKNTDNETSRN